MRPIHLVTLDKVRPALLLTRETARPYLRRITVAPITSTIRGLLSEVAVGPANGLDHDSVISLDNVSTVDRDHIGRLLGYLPPDQESRLAAAIVAAYDLEP